MLAVYTKADRDIVASIGEPFIIELEGNAPTGYQWQLEVDDTKVRVLDQQYQLVSGNIGAGGRERFTLHPLKQGKTLIRAKYKRVWEPTAIEEKEFHVQIKQ